jgi:hypothetical protein
MFSSCWNTRKRDTSVKKLIEDTLEEECLICFTKIKKTDYISRFCNNIRHVYHESCTNKHSTVNRCIWCHKEPQTIIRSANV